MQLQKPEPFVDLEFKKPAIQQFLEISKSQTQIIQIPLIKEDQKTIKVTFLYKFTTKRMGKAGFKEKRGWDR